MMPGIWISIIIICLCFIIHGWIVNQPTPRILWLCLGLNMGFIGLWYSNNPETLKHFATKYVIYVDKEIAKLKKE